MNYLHNGSCSETCTMSILKNVQDEIIYHSKITKWESKIVYYLSVTENRQNIIFLNLNNVDLEINTKKE